MSEPADRDHLQKRLDAHRLTLKALLLKKAHLGIAALPVHVFHELDEACSAIRAIKKTLLEQGGEVSDHSDDNADWDIFRGSGEGILPLSNAYASTQYDAYYNVWRSLQALRRAGDKLWRNVNYTNLKAFADQRNAVKDTLSDFQPFLEAQHYDHLKLILKKFGEFYIGKIHLAQLRSNKYRDDIIYAIAREQIDQNRVLKNEYELLLEAIGDAFRSRLAQSA
jgi:hypothetical protein